MRRSTASRLSSSGEGFSDMAAKLTEKGKDALMSLGFFVVGWSILEGGLEVAIAKQLGLSARNASIVTAGLQFKARATMLKGLLNRDPEKNAAAIETLNKIMNRGERNDLLHSLVQWDPEGLVFDRRRSDGQFRVKRVHYSREDLMVLAIEFSALSLELKKHLGITDKDHAGFFQRSHSEFIKAAKSPSPPKSSKTSRLSKSQAR